MIDVVLA